MLNSKILAVVLLLAPVAAAGDASHGRYSPLADREFQVLAAQWGTGHRWADVTEKACQLSTEAGLDVAAVRKHFGDPYPHFKKALVVFYVYRGELRSATARENGRLRVPIKDPAAAAAFVRKAAAARFDRIAKDAHSELTNIRGLLVTAREVGSIDGIVAAIRDGRDIASELVRRIGPQFVEFESFLKRHPTHRKDPGLTEIREKAAALKAEVADSEERLDHALNGLSVKTVPVKATSDWRNLEVKVGKGDLVAFEASGRWKLGGYAGTCDATGLSGGRYAPVSTVEELPHGCLLVRVGGNLFGAGRRCGSTRVGEDGPRVEAKSNDENYRDNSGELTIRLLVVPGIE